MPYFFARIRFIEVEKFQIMKNSPEGSERLYSAESDRAELVNIHSELSIDARIFQKSSAENA